jgi:hypothetical protein
MTQKSFAQVICHNEFVEISYHADLHYLEMIWSNRFTPSRTLRTIFSDLTDVLRCKRPALWLADHAVMKIISPEDQDWLFEQWVPAWRHPTAMRCLRRLAFVRSTDFFGQRSVQSLATRIAGCDRGVELHLCGNRGEASTWLFTGRTL